MKSIAERIKEALEIRRMRQVDLVEKTGIGKSSISTYISGEYEPKQRNIYKIAKALDVSEAWLMGYDVSMEREPRNIERPAFNTEHIVISDGERSLLNKYRALDDKGKHTVDTILEMEYNRHNDKSYLLPDAAHEIKGATEEDRQHDDDIMNNDNF